MKNYLEEIIHSALLTMMSAGEIPDIIIENPRSPEHGDAACNIAMVLAKPLRKPPRAIAEELVAKIDRDPSKIAAIEIAGPGFINFRFANDWLWDELGGLLADASGYGMSDLNAGKRFQVEFVSANPTGPLTVGHGRNAVLGDTVARLFEMTGATVDREYYFNNAGRQMRVLGESVRARYLQLLGRDTDLPEGGYEGEYIIDIARKLREERGDSLADTLADAATGTGTDENAGSDPDLDLGAHVGTRVHANANDEVIAKDDANAAPAPVPVPDPDQDPAPDPDPESNGGAYSGSKANTGGVANNLAVFQDIAEKLIFQDIQNTLGRLNIRMGSYFNERDLYENGDIDKVLKALREKNLIYEHEGAIWFKTRQFGKENDTVLVKSSGEPTYRLPDIAYHANKLDRGYDMVVDVFGADHIATYPDVLSGIKSLGYDISRVSVLVYQFVTIVKDGKPFKMSTRKANFVTLDELMDEVGADVTRFFFLMRSPGTHLEFDIARAREAGEKNPVFYLQYAHARIKSIMRKATEAFPDVQGGDNQKDHVQGHSPGKDLSTVPGSGPGQSHDPGSSRVHSTDLSLLTHDSEIAVIKTLLGFGDAVYAAALHMEPHRLITWLNELAAGFHRFYHDCRIIGEEKALAGARINLLKAVALALSKGLAILGIDAPERM